METAVKHTVPTAFIWRRVHSLTGLWLVIYLIVHLIVNSQAALWIGDDGHGFVRLVNYLESLPYLQVVETVLIGIPLLVHGIWGVQRALTAKSNSSSSNGSKPSLPYSRNSAYTWQRLSSWILLVGILLHVLQMRFLDYPRTARLNDQEQSMVKIYFDDGLYTLAPRLQVTLFSPEEIEQLEQNQGPLPAWQKVKDAPYDPSQSESRDLAQRDLQRADWIETLGKFHLKPGQVVAMAASPGPVVLLAVRDTFKSPLMDILYTIFVLAAAFHAFNGFWTFLIAWGAVLSMVAQKRMAKVSWFGIAALAFLGCAAIWGSYWLNLRG